MKINILTPGLLRTMNAYWSAANDLSVDQMDHYDNPLLRRPLMSAVIIRKGSALISGVCLTVG